MPRLLFDEPLSEQLCESLANLFPDSLHIRLLGRGGSGDVAVWDLTREHGCMVVSIVRFDAQDQATVLELG